MNHNLSFAIVAALLSYVTVGRAEVKPASPFTDHMVLQQGDAAPVWGTAEPGENVSVSVGDQTQSTTTGADGKWAVRLKDLKAGGPYTLTIRGKNTVKLDDVLVGEVWLCSGQSNMDFTVAKTPKFYFAGVNDEAKEVAAANYPKIRMFTGEWTRASEPKDGVAGTWKVCNPENVREFSAVGYFFARDLQKELNVPVGIVTLLTARVPPTHGFAGRRSPPTRSSSRSWTSSMTT
jgi:sialate O-acetylesterase